jgi:hypothetical protein
VDRQEAAAIVVGVEQRELLTAVHPVEGVVPRSNGMSSRMRRGSFRARATSAFWRPMRAASASNQAFKAGARVLRSARDCAASKRSER